MILSVYWTAEQRKMDMEGLLYLQCAFWKGKRQCIYTCAPCRTRTSVPLLSIDMRAASSTSLSADKSFFKGFENIELSSCSQWIQINNSNVHLNWCSYARELKIRVTLSNIYLQPLLKCWSNKMHMTDKMTSANFYWDTHINNQQNLLLGGKWTKKILEENKYKTIEPSKQSFMPNL